MKYGKLCQCSDCSFLWCCLWFLLCFSRLSVNTCNTTSAGLQTLGLECTSWISEHKICVMLGDGRWNCSFFASASTVPSLFFLHLIKFSNTSFNSKGESTDVYCSFNTSKVIFYSSTCENEAWLGCLSVFVVHCIIIFKGLRYLHGFWISRGLICYCDGWFL